MHRPSRLTAAAALAVVLPLAGPVARGGVAPPRPGTINAEDIDPENFEAEQLFKAVFPNKPHTGPLATCKICRKPLKDHVDGRVDCQAPDRRAAEIGKERTRCPVCRLGFKVPKPDPDPRAGLDHDFCRHPRGIYTLTSEIWLCPKCGYAAPFGVFETPVDEKVREFVRSTVTPGTTKFLGAIVGFKPKTFKFKDYSFIDPAHIPEHFKYENALAVAGARGAGDLDLARLHLGASHAYRRLVNRPFREAGLDKAIRRVEAMLVDPMVVDDKDPVSVAAVARRALRHADSKDALPSEKLRRRERLYLVMRLTGLHDRLGEPWWAEHHLRQAWDLAAKENEPRVRHAYVGLVRNMAEFLRRETHHRGRSAARYRRALAAGEIPQEERLVSTYLVGELLARLGDLKRARPWLEGTVRQASGSKSAGEAAAVVASWARFRLKSPAFLVGDGAGRRLVDADPEERTFVERLAAGLPVEMPAELPGKSTGGSSVTAPGTGAPARAGGPGGSTDSPDPAPAPSVVPTTVARPDAPAPAPDGSPGSCREQMERIWRAIEAYRRARGDFPPERDALVKAGLVSRREAGDFVCVGSEAKLFYRAPRAGASVTSLPQQPRQLPLQEHAALRRADRRVRQVAALIRNPASNLECLAARLRLGPHPPAAGREARAAGIVSAVAAPVRRLARSGPW
ncbi:MAG: DUF2225 domain-containing protein [Planctomycetota bacterium]|jgi:hypothetical protein